MKEIHFYEGVGSPEGTLTSWRTTKTALEAKKPVIHTTQMSLLSTSLFTSGYRIFIHPEANGPFTAYEVRLGSDNLCTARELKMEHNLFHLWEAGEFRGPVNPHRTPSKEQINTLRESYPQGARIMLTRDMEDPFVPHRQGEKATVMSVDDLGDIHVRWDSGDSLAILPGIDSFKIIGLRVEKKTGGTAFNSGLFPSVSCPLRLKSDLSLMVFGASSPTFRRLLLQQMVNGVKLLTQRAASMTPFPRQTASQASDNRQ